MYLDIDEFVSNNDLTIESNYEMLQDMMDIDSYIDYLAINEWAGCTDIGEFNNDMCWRVIVSDDSEYGDGKFRWIIHDGDTAFTPETSIMNNLMMKDGVLFNAIMSNTDFRHRFGERLIEMGKTTFSDENVQNELSDSKWDEFDKEEIRDFYKNRKSTVEMIFEEEGY